MHNKNFETLRSNAIWYVINGSKGIPAISGFKKVTEKFDKKSKGWFKAQTRGNFVKFKQKDINNGKSIIENQEVIEN